VSEAPFETGRIFLTGLFSALKAAFEWWVGTCATKVSGCEATSPPDRLRASILLSRRKVRALKKVGKQRSKKATAGHVVVTAVSKSPAVMTAKTVGKTAKTVGKTAKTTTSVLPKLIGLAIAGTGLAHFAVPQAFESITKPAFPENTREWIYANGATEALIGVAIFNSRTRVYGLVGLAGYVGFLGSRAVRA
jgi:hypothetical protein